MQLAALVVHGAHTAGHFGLQTHAREKAMQQAFIDVQHLQAVDTRAAVRVGEQAAAGAQPVAVAFQGEVVMHEQREQHRQQPQCREQQQQDERAAGQHGRQTVVMRGDLAEQLLDPVRRHTHHAARLGGVELPEGCECTGDDDHAAIRDQPEPHQLDQRQTQQHLAGSARIGPAVLHRHRCRLTRTQQRHQGIGIGDAQHLHHRLGLQSAAGFESQFGDTEYAVQQIAAAGDVLDARERDMALGAIKQPLANGQFAIADAIAETEAVDERIRGQQHRTDQGHEFPPFAASEQQQHDQRQRHVAQLRDQHEQPGKRMQATFVAAWIRRHRHAGDDRARCRAAVRR